MNLFLPSSFSALLLERLGELITRVSLPYFDEFFCAVLCRYPPVSIFCPPRFLFLASFAL